MARDFSITLVKKYKWKNMALRFSKLITITNAGSLFGLDPKERYYLPEMGRDTDGVLLVETEENLNGLRW